MNKEKELLYRKIDRKSSYQNHYDHSKKVNYRWFRNTKKSKYLAKEGVNFIPMKSKKTTCITNGYDYTPLFHFLLSKIGHNWNDVYSEVVKRLNTTEPIFWMVSINNNEEKGDFFRYGEGGYYNKLYIDDNGILQKVNPNLSNITPLCDCHTHSFNGKEVGNKTYIKNI